MKVNRLAAVRMRTRYLLEQLEECLECDTDLSIYDGFRIAEEISLLFKAAQSSPVATSDITPEQIQAARQFPIQQLIHFEKGKAYAWCHQDKRPSLTLYKNKAKCWPCNKTYDTIGVLMERDKMSFKDAVRRLS